MTGGQEALETSGRPGPPVDAIAPGFRHETADGYKKMYDRCSAMARIGVWQCDLSTEALTWTDGVYDLHDLPRGAPVTRQQIIALYDEDCRREMERLRGRAIAERGGFTLDVRVRTAAGVSRWIRITAEVECEGGEPVRIFGLQQDVTREKDLLERLQRLAELDALTGLANRGAFETRLGRAAARPQDEPHLAALFLVDVDQFKQVNDTFGHGVGDDCLRHVADVLRHDLPENNLAARLGGDEFAVLVFGDVTPDAVEAMAARLVARSQRLIVRDGRMVEVSVSVGVAMAGDRCETGWTSDLVRHADVALYAAKRSGRNRFHLDRRDSPPPRARRHRG